VIYSRRRNRGAAAHIDAQAGKILDDQGQALSQLLDNAELFGLDAKRCHDEAILDVMMFVLDDQEDEMRGRCFVYLETTELVGIEVCVRMVMEGLYRNCVKEGTEG
jgi:hypothetical protein